MVIKEQIMLTAFDLFSEHGIKNVSMDDIAHNASISKRTLYELFEDKETLLTECINLSYTKMRLSMKRLESEPITALDHCGGLRSISGILREISRRLPQSDEAKGSPQQSD